MKIAIIGSRDFSEREKFNYELEKIIFEHNITISEIISGGAKGADTFGENYAQENNIPCTIFKPNWKAFGKKAGIIRNKDIIKNSEIVIAFWNGTSKGTANSLKIAKQENKKVFIVNI